MSANIDTVEVSSLEPTDFNDIWYFNIKKVFEIDGDELNSKCLGCLTCKITFKDNNNNDDDK